MVTRVRLFMCVLSLAVLAPQPARPQESAAAATTPFVIRQAAYIKASNAEMGDHFADGGNLPGHAGNALAISADGSTMAVGAPHESSAATGVKGDQSDNSLYSSGAVYVFTLQGGSWVQQAYVKASNPGQGDNFGSNIAFSADGNTMAVSAYLESSAAKGINGDQEDYSLGQAGAVYVFTRSGSTWMQQAYIKASNTGRPPSEDDPFGDGDQFGFAIALSADGNTLAVSSLSEDSAATGVNGTQEDDSAPDAGAVYIFSRNGSNWAQGTYLKSNNNEEGDRFGFSVALSANGDTLAVGAYDENGSGRTVNAADDNDRNGTGAIYAFVRENGQWRQQAYLKGSQQNRNDALGEAVAISADGNTIVGGSADDACLVAGIHGPDGPYACRGAALPAGKLAGSAGGVYVWVRSGTMWTEQAYIKASNPDFEDLFGVRLALSADGNVLVVGDPNEDARGQGVNTADPRDNSASEAGSAFVFTRSGGRWTQRAYVKGSNTDEFDEFGTSTAISGDGKTILFGARMEASGATGVNGNQSDNSAPGTGAVYVFKDDRSP